jgi:hypothetical protein
MELVTKYLKRDLNLHPYKITVVQKLLPRHFPTVSGC